MSLKVPPNDMAVGSEYFSRSSSGARNVRISYSRKTKSRPDTAIEKTSVRPNPNENMIVRSEQNETKSKVVRKKVKLSGSSSADIVESSRIGISNVSPIYGLDRLKDNFFDVPCQDLAKGLLGKVLVRQLDDGTVLKGRIVETECYLGGEDKASHSYNGRITERSKPMYMKPGTMYVYLTYGMYHCFNISSRGPGAAVLLRALEPIEGLEYMKLQRKKGKKKSSSPDTKNKNLKVHELCNGPAKLCMCLNITKITCNEQDLTTWDEMWIEEDETNQRSVNPCCIVTSHRIGIDSVGIEWASKPLRFYLLGNSSVSRRDKLKEKELEDMAKCFH